LISEDNAISSAPEVPGRQADFWGGIDSWIVRRPGTIGIWMTVQAPFLIGRVEYGRDDAVSAGIAHR
jgi:hypothetical protein